MKLTNNTNDRVVTEEEKREEVKKSFYYALCGGNKENIISYLDEGKDQTLFYRQLFLIYSIL